MSCRRAPRLAGWARYADGGVFDGATRHPGNAELIYLERGRMQWGTAASAWDIHAPAMLLAWPGEAERRRFIGASRHAYVHVALDHHSLRTWRAVPPSPPLAITADSVVPTVFRHLVDLILEGRSDASGVILAACRLLLAIALSERVQGSPRALDELPATMRRVLLWLEQEWSTRGVRLCTLEELAVAAGCSPRHCGRLFQEHLGLQPVTAIQHLRAGLAQIQLQRTDRSVKEIAAGLGFRNPNHLAQLLVSTFGVAPVAMRRAWRAGQHVPSITSPILREMLTVINA